MKQNLQYKILCAVMAMGAIGLTAASPALAAEGIIVDEENKIIHANGNRLPIGGDSKYKGNYDLIFGAGDTFATTDATGANITIDSGNHNYVHGGTTLEGSAYKNIVIINGDKENTTSIHQVTGGSSGISAYGNTVTINGYTQIISDEALPGMVIGGGSMSGNVYNNNVYINEFVNVEGDVYAGQLYSSGSIYNNNVYISNESTINGNVYGGSSDSGSVTNNKVEINNSATITNNIYGGHAEGSTDTNNTTTISGNTVIIGSEDNPFTGTIGEAANEDNNYMPTGFIYGGLIGEGYKTGYPEETPAPPKSGDVTGNKVFIYAKDTNTEPVNNDYQFNQNVYGGYAEAGNANNNEVTINGGTFANEVYGGYSAAGNADSNNVNINGGYFKYNVYGGSGTLSASDNNVGIIGGTFMQAIYGGSANTSDAESKVHNNNVSISGKVILPAVYGGFSTSSNSNSFVTNNYVNIINANLNALEDYTPIEIYGGSSGSSISSGNVVNIINSSATEDSAYTTIYVYGANSASGNVTCNEVNITDSTVGYVYGGNSEQGYANNNYVDIKDSTINQSVYGSYTDAGESSGNSVKISNSSVHQNIYGGYSDQGSANNNTVHITNDTKVGIFDYEASRTLITGAEAGTSASGNKVIIDSLTMPDTGIDIYGAMAIDSASNNTVIIKGGEFKNTDIYAAFADNVTNNNITITGNAILTGANLYGYNNRFYNHSGNSLNIDGWSGKVNSVNNFDSLNFTNIDWNRDKNEAVLVINNGNGETSMLSNTSVSEISFTGGGHIRPGDKYTLIKNENGFFTPSSNRVTSSFDAGVALTGDGTATTIYTQDSSLVYEVKSVRTSKQADLVTQSRAVAAAFVNQGTDLISDSLDTLSRDNAYGVKTFAAVHGNRSKYDVNSDLKINGWSTIVGVGNSAEFNDGDEFSWGVFYENGSGNYRTYNEFNNEFFRGDGSLVYNGGGIAARYENASGVYTEGSLRAGMLKNEMENVLQDTNHVGHGYETESAYYGAHIGVGKIISLSDSSDLDVYGKFFHTYTEGDSFTVANDKFELDSITSDRLRLGARITTNKENAFSTYYGLAYEYEFNGDADMTAQGVAAPQESLQGRSYMAEVGFNYQPTPDSPWSFDLNLRGYAGEREGGSFNVQATYTF